MYLYEKQGSRIKVSELFPNMEAIKELKEQEVYGKLDYLTMMRAETNANINFLLDDNVKTKTGVVNSSFPLIYPKYHKLEQDNYISIRESFANLSKVINTPILKTVKYKDYADEYFIVLTDPRYRIIAFARDCEIKEMCGIVPVTERLYQANELVRRIQEGDLELMYRNMPEGYFRENSGLLEVRNINTPNMWLSNLEELYNYGIINGSIEDFNKKLEISDEIMSRVRRK